MNCFNDCFNLKKLHITSKAAPADTEAAEADPRELKRLLQEGYFPEWVFSADRMGLFWKKMTECPYTAKAEKAAPGFKVAKDQVTVLLCGNAVGHLIKPGMLYRFKNHWALKGKNKNLLPVYRQSSKKSWVIAESFLDCVHNISAGR